MLTNTRSCGILLHPTSLPGPHGIGTLGQHAHAFVEFLHEAGQSIWQVLPLGPTGYGDSPYACFSTFAGNPLLIDLEDLQADGLIEKGELDRAPQSCERVDFGAVFSHKTPLLAQAAKRFLIKASGERKAAFEAFCNAQAWWLEDYALFTAIKKAHQGRPINEWDPQLKKRAPGAVHRIKEELADDLQICRVQQFYFFRQWQALRDHAHKRKISILGDMPLFVAYDSAEVWANPSLFKVDDNLSPRDVAGVPPD